MTGMTLLTASASGLPISRGPAFSGRVIMCSRSTMLGVLSVLAGGGLEVKAVSCDGCMLFGASGADAVDDGFKFSF